MQSNIPKPPEQDNQPNTADQDYAIGDVVVYVSEINIESLETIEAYQPDDHYWLGVGWLHQFGAWMRSASGACGRSIHPIAVAMDNAIKAQRYKKISKEKRQQIIIDYLTSDFEIPQPRQIKISCQIDDNEARAVQRLILDLQGQAEILDEWMNAIIERYFYNCSWSEMVTLERTQNDARSDVKCGLAALHSRYGFILF